MCGASQAGQPGYRVDRRHAEYSIPGTMNASQHTASQITQPRVYVLGSPCVPQCEQIIIGRPPGACARRDSVLHAARARRRAAPRALW
jgi:hypothetical protein